MNTEYTDYRQKASTGIIVLIKEKLRHIFHNTHDSRETARSVAIGMFVALTPTFGIQIIMVVLLWNILRFSERLRFNMPVAISLTFVTNYFTTIPYYFVCYHTGAWIYNNVNSHLDYQAFLTQLHMAMSGGLFHLMRYLVKCIPGVFRSILIGSLLYSTIVSVLSYKLVLYRINGNRRRNNPQ